MDNAALLKGGALVVGLLLALVVFDAYGSVTGYAVYGQPADAESLCATGVGWILEGEMLMSPGVNDFEDFYGVELVSTASSGKSAIVNIEHSNKDGQALSRWQRVIAPDSTLQLGKNANLRTFEFRKHSERKGEGLRRWTTYYKYAIKYCWILTDTPQPAAAASPAASTTPATSSQGGSQGTPDLSVDEITPFNQLVDANGNVYFTGKISFTATVNNIGGATAMYPGVSYKCSDTGNYRSPWIYPGDIASPGSWTSETLTCEYETEGSYAITVKASVLSDKNPDNDFMTTGGNKVVIEEAAPVAQAGSPDLAIEGISATSPANNYQADGIAQAIVQSGAVQFTARVKNIGAGESTRYTLGYKCSEGSESYQYQWTPVFSSPIEPGGGASINFACDYDTKGAKSVKVKIAATGDGVGENDIGETMVYVVNDDESMPFMPSDYFLIGSKLVAYQVVDAAPVFSDVATGQAVAAPGYATTSTGELSDGIYVDLNGDGKAGDVSLAAEAQRDEATLITLKTGYNLIGINALNNKLEEGTTCDSSQFGTALVYYTQEGIYGEYALSSDLELAEADSYILQYTVSREQSEQMRQRYPQAVSATGGAYVLYRGEPCLLRTMLQPQAGFSLPDGHSMLGVQLSWKGRSLGELLVDNEGILVDNDASKCDLFSGNFYDKAAGYRKFGSDYVFGADDVGSGFWIRANGCGIKGAS